MLPQFDFKDYIIAPLVSENAFSLNRLMLRNAKQFSLFFPKTLAANLTEEESQRFITTISEDIQNRTQFLFAIKSNNEVAGLIYIKELDWEKKEGEFAVCIGSRYSGKGWVTQSVVTLSDYAFKELGIQVLNFIVHESNKKSIAVAERCGFTFIKELEKEFTPLLGEPMDMQLYQLKHKDI